MRNVSKSWIREREVAHPNRRMMERTADLTILCCPRCGSKRTMAISCYESESLRKCIICGHLWPAPD